MVKKHWSSSMNSRVFQASVSIIMLLVVGIWLMAAKYFFGGLVVVALGLAFLALVFGLLGEPTTVVVLVAYGLWYLVYGIFALTFIQQLGNHPRLLSLLIFSHVCVAVSGLLAASFPPGHISPWVIVSPALASMALSVLFVFGCAAIPDLRTKQRDQLGSVK
jgi:hypothetical protein